MLPKDVIKKIRKIEIRTKKLVNDVFSGEYHSVFKGRGMEFQEVREYQPGDDIRIIDWNVTARYGFPFVKKFQEERELTVVILWDASSSGKFGTQEKMKSELAAEICSLLAFSAIKNNDKVGMIIFTDQVEKFIPPQKGRSHVLRLIREVLYYEPQNKGTNLAAALDFLGRVLSRKAVVFIVSDFLSSDYDKPLKIANRRHDVVAIRITDPREMELPPVGFLELEDAETGEQILVDSSDFLTRRQFSMFSNSEREKLTRKFKSINLDSVEVFTGKSYIIPLVSFFKQRAKKYR